MDPNFPSDIITAATECGEKIFGDSFSSALECAHSPLGIQLLLEFEEKKVDTLLPRLTYVPWMTVNDKHSYTLEHHIQRTICDAYTVSHMLFLLIFIVFIKPKQGKEKPLDCYQIYDAVERPVVIVHYEPADHDSQFFFTSSLMPHHVFEIGEIKLIPFGRSTYTESTKKCAGDETCGKYKEHVSCYLLITLHNLIYFILFRLAFLMSILKKKLY